MSSQIITAIIGVFAALCGTTIGGLITYFTHRDLKRKEWVFSVLREEINDRKKLYSDFLAEAYRLTLISIQTKHDNLKEFEILNRYLAQIELLSTGKIIDEAKAIVDHVIVCHSMNSGKQSRSFFDVKTSFINEAKEDIHKLKNS